MPDSTAADNRDVFRLAPTLDASVRHTLAERLWRDGRSRSGEGQPAGGRPLARSLAGCSPAVDHEPGQAITARAEVGIAVG